MKNFFLDEEENINSLCMEATMPLEQVMAKYQSEGQQSQSKNEKNEINNRIYSASPYLRSRKGKERASCSSSGAGCSSSSSSWNTNESDVSSSSQPCGSSSSTSADRKECETAGSSEAEQVLDSTTSNGEVAETAERVASTQDNESTKSADMPDSSEDIKDKVSSPTKTPQAEQNVNDTEINGGGSKDNFGNADSSKSGTDSAISSSCTLVENGETEEQAKISSSNTRKRPTAIELYKSLLQEYAERIENEDEEDDDDDDEDESFVGNRKK